MSDQCPCGIARADCEYHGSAHGIGDKHPTSQQVWDGERWVPFEKPEWLCDDLEQLRIVRGQDVGVPEGESVPWDPVDRGPLGWGTITRGKGGERRLYEFGWDEPGGNLVRVYWRRRPLDWKPGDP